MAEENFTWGAERIRGELLKLGINVSKRTIQRYLPTPAGLPPHLLRRHGRSSSETTLPKSGSVTSHRSTTSSSSRSSVFVIIELSSRRIVHIALSAATTAHPTDA